MPRAELPAAARPAPVPSLRRPLSSAGTTLLSTAGRGSAESRGSAAVREASRAYEAVRQSQPVDWAAMDSITDARARGPFTQQQQLYGQGQYRAVAGSESAESAALFPPSSAGSALLQPAWNDSTAADWNARLPYSGQDALAQATEEEAGPLTAKYRQHIRRASLDSRTFGRLWAVENARLRLERMPADERPPADFFFHGHVLGADTSQWDSQHLRVVQQREAKKQRTREQRSDALAERQKTHWTQQASVRQGTDDGEQEQPKYVAHVKLSSGCPAQLESTFERVLGGCEGGSRCAQVALDQFRFHQQPPHTSDSASERAQRLSSESRGRRDVHIITNQPLQHYQAAK